MCVLSILPEITQEEKVQSALGEMPYYGDTANCKMTAEQATAFAQLIADGLAGDFSFRGGYDENTISDIISWNEPFHINQVDAYINEYETNRSNVIVGDFSGEGIPMLMCFFFYICFIFFVCNFSCLLSVFHNVEHSTTIKWIGFYNERRSVTGES